MWRAPDLTPTLEVTLTPSPRPVLDPLTTQELAGEETYFHQGATAGATAADSKPVVRA